jgi:hypothetical protein
MSKKLTAKQVKELESYSEDIEELKKTISSYQDLLKKRQDQINEIINSTIVDEISSQILTFSADQPVEIIQTIVEKRFSNGYKIHEIKPVYTEEGTHVQWRVILHPIKDFQSVKVETPHFKISRSAFTKGDKIDFEYLKSINRALYDAIVEKEETVTVEYHVDEKKLHDVIAENPEVLADLQEATMKGNYQKRLDIKRLEND